MTIVFIIIFILYSIISLGILFQTDIIDIFNNYKFSKDGYRFSKSERGYLHKNRYYDYSKFLKVYQSILDENHHYSRKNKFITFGKYYELFIKKHHSGIIYSEAIKKYRELYNFIYE